MKKTTMAVLTVALVISPFNAPAQLTVFDPTALASFACELTSMYSQYENQISQIQQMSSNLLNMGSVSAFFNIGSLLNGSLIADINDLNSIGDYSDMNLGGIISNGHLNASMVTNSSQFMHLENLLCGAVSSFDGVGAGFTSGFTSVTCRIAGMQIAQSNEDYVESNTISVLSSLAADESSLISQIVSAKDVATQTGLLAQLSEDHALAERAQNEAMIAHNATVNAYMANEAMNQAAALGNADLACSLALGVVSSELESDFSDAESAFDASYAASVNPMFNFSYIPPQ
jgi:hypothetical protein